MGAVVGCGAEAHRPVGSLKAITQDQSLPIEQRFAATIKLAALPRVDVAYSHADADGTAVRLGRFER